MNRLQYYRDMLLTRLGHWGVRGQREAGGAVFTTSGRAHLDRRRPVIIHLDDPLMHVGDQMFFRPLAVRLSEAGFNVTVTNRPNLNFLFADLPRSPRGAQPGALVVTRVQALRHAYIEYGPAADYFAFYYSSRSIGHPIANFILEAFADWFGAESLSRSIDASCFLHFPLDPTGAIEKFGIPRESPLLFVSNYIDSGLHRKLPWRERDMLRRAVVLKRELGGIVIHLGTAQDRERDGRDYSEFVDHDLRGRTTVQDLFDLLSIPTIGAVMCFDTAILHIAHILNQKIFLYRRHYFTRAEREQKAAAFDRFYERT